MNNIREKIKSNKDIWKIDLIIIFVFIILVIAFSLWSPELPSREVLDELIQKYGSLGPLAIIGIIILEVIIAPIPGSIIPIAVGAIYGVFLGTLYTWIGNVIGSCIAFWIARKLGRPIVKKIISEEKIKRYDNFLHRNKFLMWIVYIVPIFPIDIISFVIGLSAVKFKRFLLVITIGFIPYLLILNFFGQQLFLSSGWVRLIYGSIILLIVLVGFSVERIISKEKLS